VSCATWPKEHCKLILYKVCNAYNVLLLLDFVGVRVVIVIGALDLLVESCFWGTSIEVFDFLNIAVVLFV
jgi:hypothetical protein